MGGIATVLPTVIPADKLDRRYAILRSLFGSRGKVAIRCAKIIFRGIDLDLLPGVGGQCPVRSDGPMKPAIVPFAVDIGTVMPVAPGMGSAQFWRGFAKHPAAQKGSALPPRRCGQGGR